MRAVLLAFGLCFYSFGAVLGGCDSTAKDKGPRSGSASLFEAEEPLEAMAEDWTLELASAELLPNSESVFAGISAPSREDLEPLASFLALVWQRPVAIGSTQVLSQAAWVHKRAQLDADRALAVLEGPSVRGGRLLVSKSDLFVVGHQHIFGIADPKGGVALLSTHRLGRESTEGPRRSSGSPSAAQKLRRLLILGLHESAHLFGFEHCKEPNPCVLKETASLEELDQAPLAFCSHHQRLVEAKVGVAAPDRVEALADFADRHALYPEAQIFRRHLRRMSEQSVGHQGDP